MTLRRFIESLGCKTQAQVALAILYFRSEIDNSDTLPLSNLPGLFADAGHPQPANPSMVMSSLRKQRLVLASSPARYRLTSAGVRAIQASMAANQVSLQAAEPLEKTSQDLARLVQAIRDQTQRGYMEEALRCINCRAYRAAVMMGWCAVMWRLRHDIADGNFPAFVVQLDRLRPGLRRNRRVDHVNDLEDFKDADIVEVCEALRFYDKAVKTALLECLNLRNGCSHPTEVVPEVYR